MHKKSIILIAVTAIFILSIAFLLRKHPICLYLNVATITSIASICTVFLALGAIFVSLLTFRKNMEHLKVQQFESTFFNMTEQLEDIVNKLSIGDKTGRDVFQYLYEGVTIKINNTPFFDLVKKTANEINSEEISGYERQAKFIKIHPGFFVATQNGKFMIDHLNNPLNLRKFIDNFGIQGYEEFEYVVLLDHYFRYMYRIMKFVDESTFLDKKGSMEKRYKYMGNLRAILSPYELVFLFYNDLSKAGNEKVKPLVQQYSLFKNLRRNLLANSRRDYNLELFDDGYDNDYDRFIEKPSQEETKERSFIYTASAVSKKDNKHLNS